MYTVKKLSMLAGVTPRTLHYYDEIGLLKPSHVGDNGYRYYGKEAVYRLQQILLYREMDVPLHQIMSFLDCRDNNLVVSLERHKRELQARVDRLQRLLKTVDKTIIHLRGDEEMSPPQFFDGFSEKQQAEYEEEAMTKYDPETVKKSNEKWRRLSVDQKQQLIDEGNAVYQAFYQSMPKGATSEEAQLVVGRWRKLIEKFWKPSDDQLLGLVDLYNQDERFKQNYDRIHPHLAEFIKDAVKEYVEHKRKNR